MKLLQGVRYPSLQTYHFSHDIHPRVLPGTWCSSTVACIYCKITLTISNITNKWLLFRIWMMKFAKFSHNPIKCDGCPYFWSSFHLLWYLNTAKDGCGLFACYPMIIFDNIWYSEQKVGNRIFNPIRMMIIWTKLIYYIFCFVGCGTWVVGKIFLKFVIINISKILGGPSINMT